MANSSIKQIIEICRLFNLQRKPNFPGLAVFNLPNAKYILGNDSSNRWARLYHRICLHGLRNIEAITSDASLILNYSKQSPPSSCIARNVGHRNVWLIHFSVDRHFPAVQFHPSPSPSLNRKHAGFRI